MIHLISLQILEVIDNNTYGPLSSRTAALLPFVISNEQRCKSNLNESSVMLRMERFIQQFKNTCLYDPTGERFNGEVTLIRGRQRQKGLKLPGDYYLSKVRGIDVRTILCSYLQFQKVFKSLKSHCPKWAPN